MKLISLQLRFDTGMMVSWKIAQQEDLQKPNLRKSIAHFSHMVIQPRSQRKLFLLTVYLTHLRWLTLKIHNTDRFKQFVIPNRLWNPLQTNIPGFENLNLTE